MTRAEPTRHRTWELGLRVWRAVPWPGGRGRDRAKAALTRTVTAPRPVPTKAGWLLLEHGPDSLERHLLTTGTHWESRVVDLLMADHRALDGATVLDVGGHVGFYALLLADLVGPQGRVVAIEAHAELCERIRWAGERNRRPWLEVVHGAAGDRPGPVALGKDPDRGHTTAAAGGGGATFTVDGVMLDQWAHDRDLPEPDLVLMDIEGGEAAALRGLRRLLVARSPDLVIEIHPEQLAALGTPQDQLIAWIAGQGPYDLAVVDHRRGLLPLDHLPAASSWHLLARNRETPVLLSAEIPLSP